MNQQDIDNTPKHNPFRAFIIIVIALLIVAAISLLPLEQYTGGTLKSFNLLSDLFEPDTTATPSSSQPSENIDPELLKAINEGPTKIQDSIPAPQQPGGESQVAKASTQITDVVIDSAVIAAKPARVGNLVQIEDYTADQAGLKRLRSALASGRLARIAVVGDSYIEGDIFSQDLRDQLQSAFGGSGVGYMNMFSEFPGFRRSVTQGGKGWTEFALSKKGKPQYFGLSQHYFTPTAGATATYKGASKLAHTASWTNSKFLFISPQPSVIKVKTGAEWETHNVNGSPEVQQINVVAPTSEFAVSTSSPSVVALGVWLDNNQGVSVDCMSSRGFSGITLSKIDANLCRQMSKFINYDLIVLEFGINAMSASQTDYSIYANRMVSVINHIRSCYPSADILLMGIGDRGEKKGGEVRSMATGNNMIAAQRDIARRTHTMFWDTREAMGGPGAIVDWAKNGMANKDYIHLTHKGGAQLATKLVEAIRKNVGR